MKQLSNLLLLLCGLLLAVTVTPTAEAAKSGKGAKETKPVKEKLVLMPMRLSEEDKSLQGAMETALAMGLQQKYEVFSGEQVAQKAREIFMKESHSTAKKECDETRCMQDIAGAFQSELIATANVTKRDNGYFLAISIQNIFDNKLVYSNSIPCRNCDVFQVVDKLKELSEVGVAVVPAAALPEPVKAGGNANDPETAFWTEVQKGNSRDDYETYLAQYPKGKYIALAKGRIKKLQDEAAAEAERKDQEAWDAADKAGSEEAYQGYIKGYPNGHYASLAQVRIRRLQTELAAKQEAERQRQQAEQQRKEAEAASEGQRQQAERQRKQEEDAKAAASSPAMVAIPGRNFEIGKYLVTQAEWRSVMGSDPPELKFKNCGDNCPVEGVSWNDIQQFLQKLNAKTGRQYRLLTEAEWEYACYGGSKTEYCGGDDLDGLGWYNGNSGGTTHPVGQKRANGYGLYDMSGNVWEWMSDCLDSSCGARVLRGGSWYYAPEYSRAAYSRVSMPDLRDDDHGFRVAR